jgi:hypothetical protein
MIDLKGANIVLLASHNPSILTPDWIRNRKVITESPVQSFYNPTFSLFESEHFLLTVDPLRLQLSLKSLDRVDYLKNIPEALKIYVDNFKGISYKAIGLNFIWEYSFEKTKRVELSTRVYISDSYKDLIDVFEGDRKSLGSIVYVESTPYKLRVMIEPFNESTLKFDFNYHYDVLEYETEKITIYLDGFEAKLKESESLVEKIVGEKNG